ncbi:putative protein tyrosine phosphatase [Xanthomonas sp. F1]
MATRDAVVLARRHCDRAAGDSAARTPAARRMTRNVLFVCSRNRLRSPTAEQVFATWPGVETASAGVDHAADTPVTPELLEWADLIFVMETMHRAKLSRRFKRHLGRARIVCLDIPDDFAYMDPALVQLLTAKVSRHLPAR